MTEQKKLFTYISVGMIVEMKKPTDNFYINRFGEVVNMSDSNVFVIWFNKNGERGTRVQEWVDASNLKDVTFTT